MQNDIRKQKKQVAKDSGEWIAHNIKLSEESYTISKNLNYDTIKLRRVMQIINDLFAGDLSSIKGGFLQRRN